MQVFSDKNVMLYSTFLMVEVTIFYNDVYVTYYDISCVGDSVSISSSVREDKKRGLLYEDFFR